MAVGLQLWDASGRLVLDGSTRCGRIKDMVYVNGSDGAVGANLSDGTPWWSFMPEFLFKHISMNAPVPIIDIDANGVRWRYSTTSDGYRTPVQGWLVYGVY